MPVICDGCGERYGRYTELARCDDCMNQVCEECAQDGTLYTDEGRLRCQCQVCWEDARNDRDDWYADDIVAVDETVSDVIFD